VAAGVTAAIALVFARSHSLSAGRQIAYDEIAAAPRQPATATSAQVSVVSSENAVELPPTPPSNPSPGVIASEPKESPQPALMVSVPVAPSRAAAVPRDKAIKRTRSELERAWTEALVTELEHVKDADCEEYNALLEKERAAKPTPVVEAAARRTSCEPRLCLADAFAEQGQEHYAMSRLVEALASYEAAYACRPTPQWGQKRFIIACNLGDLAKARLYWRQLPAPMRWQAAPICARNQITEEMLDATE
jgi:hypothetical protein